MDYLHVKNLEKYHPGYKDRDLKWAKVYVKMVHGDSDCEMITNETDWGRLIKFILLELQSQKPIPLDNGYLVRKGFDLKKRPISLTIQMLHVFVEVCNGDGVSIVTAEEEIGNIYFAQAGESGPVKIGYTARPVKYRLQKLQTGNPEAIKLLKEIKGTLEQEKALHLQFSAYSLRNEWYSPDPKFLKEVDGVTEDEDARNRKPNPPLRREDKSKIREDKEQEIYAVTPNIFRDYWNSTRLQKIQSFTEQRRKQLKIRTADAEFLARWKEVVDKLAASDFCNGHNDRKWKVKVDWILKNDTNYIKVLEGNYDNKPKEKTPTEKIAEAEEKWGTG